MFTTRRESSAHLLARPRALALEPQPVVHESMDRTEHPKSSLLQTPDPEETARRRHRDVSEFFEMARAVGFEPTTNRLTADCSTAELRPNTPRAAVTGRAPI